MSLPENSVRAIGNLRIRDSRRKAISLLALIVVLITALALMVPALSMTHGDLVCDLNEHVHTDSCYEQVLTCTEEEGEDHQHGEECYTEELVCDIPEHQHVDSCYAAEEPEPEPEAVPEAEPDVEETSQSQAPSESEPVSDSDPADETDTQPASEASDDSPAGEAESNQDVDAASDAQWDDSFVADPYADEPTADSDETTVQDWEFSDFLTDKDGNLIASVKATAPADALPAGTQMTFERVRMDKVEEATLAAIEKQYDLEATPAPKLAVKIAFKDADGKKVTLADTVEVRLTSHFVRESEYPALVRVAMHEGEPASATVVDPLWLANEDANDTTTGDENTLVFSLTEPAVYVLADLVPGETPDEGAIEEADADTAEADADTAEADADTAEADADTAEADADTAEADVADQDADDEPESTETRTLITTETETRTLITTDDSDMPAQSFEQGLVCGDSANPDSIVKVSVEAPEGALPANTQMRVMPVDSADVEDAIDKAVAANAEPEGKTSHQKAVTKFQAVDIAFVDANGQEIEPAVPVTVRMATADIANAAADANADQPLVVHVDDRGKADVVDQLTRKQAKARDLQAAADDELLFDAEAFSVYAIVYTVDFAWNVDGKTYEYSLPGGGFISLSQLVEALGASEHGTQSQSDATRTFVADIENVTFTNPELVWVGKAEADTTAGALKEANKLNAEYSAELNKDQIAEIDAQTIEAGDWAVISLKPFTSEEALTVTMTNGETFTIRVTDAQISTLFLSDSGQLFEATVTYDEKANIPEGSTLRVTEFSENDAEYDYARQSVLADKKARGEWVDVNSFGLAALDISILNPAEEEIEPEAPVQVELRIKELPGVENLDEIADTLAIQHHVEVQDGVVVETVFDGSPEASFRLQTNETVAAEGKAVDPNSVSEEDFAASTSAETDGLKVGFEAAAFSTFTISWNNAYGNGVKVHYVDQDGNELNVSNTTLPTTLTGSSTSPAYLIYDIEGYEYDHTYRRYYNNGWHNQTILPELIRHDATYYYGDNWNGWQYTDGSTDYWGYYNMYTLSASNAQNKDEIYVVYNKKNDVVPGGTPTVTPSGSVDPPVAPRINKESTPNGDDTNTLALSLISDTALLEVEKLADVIVVFDVSGSMADDMGGQTRLEAAKDAVNTLAEQLSERTNSSGDPLVRMSLIQFSTTASTVLGMTELTTTGANNGLSQVQAAVNGLSAGGGTNWDHALQLANEENDLDSGRATFVIFVTDGDPTFRNTRLDVTDLDLQGETNDQAWTQYGQVAPNPYYLSDSVYGPGDNDKTGQCYAAAVAQGEAIVDAGKNVYTIGISNDVTKVQTFNTDIGGNGAYLAADSAALQQAFSDIEASIAGASGWGNIEMTDGITNLSNTVQKTGLVNVGGDFTYWIAPAPENWSTMTDAEKNAYKPNADDFVPWDPEAAGAELAEYNEETGAVEWKMGSTFMPEAGVTYQVRFKVWPSQEAYDYIAKLNNGTLNYDTLPAEVKAQIKKVGDTYTLKTNEDDANTTYQPAVKTGDTVTVSGDPVTLQFPSVEDLGLSVDRMTVKKLWVNDLDPDARWQTDVTLLLTDGDGELYKEIDLTEDNNFTVEDNFISCGLAKTEGGELVIYEQGHDFKLTEPEEYAYYWDLDSQVYRPMIIDSQLTMLVKTDAPSGMGARTYYEDDQGVKYYKIGEGVYRATSTGDSAATITATNVRRSNLNLTKKVVDEAGNPVVSSEPFTFVVTVNDTQDEDVWFSVQADANDTTTIVKELTTDATAEYRNGEKTGYYHAPSGSPISVALEPGWNLRFTNLPNGTTYTISENAVENYTFVGATIDNNGTFVVESGTTTGSGTISKSNTQYTVTYTNRATTHQVNILKTNQEGTTPLPGAVFSLYTEGGYNADPKVAIKTNLTSDEDGKIELGTLACGSYYLVETSAPAGYLLLTEPVEITVASSGVTYNQSGNSLSQSNEGVIHQNETDPYVLTVTNNAGQELPNTGGPGTSVVYLLGLMLTGLAGVILVMNRRRGESGDVA